jgi:hypothetical protein
MQQSCALDDAWKLRNAAADTLLRAEEHVRRLVEAASPDELVRLVESFSPTRSPGPEWTRSFDPLAERLWAWCPPETMAALEAEFRARGKPWDPVANAFTPGRGAELRDQLRHPRGARYPAFTLA